LFERYVVVEEAVIEQGEVTAGLKAEGAPDFDILIAGCLDLLGLDVGMLCVL
jgi:hypothetical protein